MVPEQETERQAAPLDASSEKGFEPNSDNPERLFAALDGKAAFLLIRRLPLTYQKVMRMRYVHDLSLKEISLITGQTKNTVAVQTHCGLEKLRYLYDHPVVYA